jgi:hypothetical protein
MSASLNGKWESIFKAVRLFRRGELTHLRDGVKGKAIQIGRRLFYYKSVMLYWLPGEPTHGVESKVPIKLERVTARNVEQATSIADSGVHSFREMLVEGQLGFYAYHEGKVVHYSWVIVNDGGPAKRYPIWLNMVWHHLGEREAHIHNCETASLLRGCGIYPAALMRICKFLIHEKGYRAIYISVAEDNLPSVKGIVKAGFIPLKKIQVINFLGLQIRYKTLSN